jgi:acetate---CoA ligase (ADP-forming)
MHPLSSLLDARSVAVVGASARPGSFGRQMLLELSRGGYAGKIYPVNPRYDDVIGLRCYRSVDEVDDDVDLALLGVSNALIEDQLRAAAAAGVKAAVIYASCYEETVPGSPSLADRLTELARDSGVTICGGNCMGFLNLTNGLRACGFPMPAGLAEGGITFISHSGSAFSAMAHNDRGLSFNLVVSAGGEFTTTAADYLNYALDLESTRVVGLFLETVRDPGPFRAALAKAADLDIPIVTIKVGREARARDLVVAHSGALAGSDAAYEALFDAYGVTRTATLDEMSDTLELFTAGRRAGPGGLAAVHDSGGERALIVDVAADAGVPFAQISDQTEKRLAAVLEEGLAAVNPLDAWGTGNDAENIYLECIDALLDDPDTAALAFCVDLTTEDEATASYVGVAVETFGRTSKPFAMLSNLSSAIDAGDAATLRTAGVPVLEGTATGLAAFRHLFQLRDHRARPSIPLPAIDGERAVRWREQLAAGPLSESESLALVADYGVPAVKSVTAGDLDGAVAAAESIGWPVVLKTAAADIAHKADAGGVVLGIHDPIALEAAYADLSGRLGPAVTVAAMSPPGVELALGVVRDEQFGPLVMVGAGGVLIEILRDRRWALPPVDAERALAMLQSLEIRRLLGGRGGARPVDAGAVAEAIVAIGRLALELGNDIHALDINPIIATPSGCLAVDALVQTRSIPNQLHHI